MEKELTFNQASNIFGNWAYLDLLRDDEAIKAFKIRNAIQATFQAHVDNQKKLQEQKKEVLTNIIEDVQKLKDANANSVKDINMQKMKAGDIKFSDLPSDLEYEYKPKTKDINQQLNNLGGKKEVVEFEPLTREDLDGYEVKEGQPLLNGKTLRLFGEIIDLSSQPEAVEEGQENGKRQPEEVTDK